MDILVVDDDPFLLATLGEALRMDGTHAVLASDALEALRCLETGDAPDAIVIDLDMRDGPLVLARLEAVAENDLPVVALSSSPGRLLEAGAADVVVTKPFEVGQLRECVQRACDLSRGAW